MDLVAALTLTSKSLELVKTLKDIDSSSAGPNGRPRLPSFCQIWPKSKSHLLT
jgi:hypothetical protein